jgi:hypothetical protein
MKKGRTKTMRDENGHLCYATLEKALQCGKQLNTLGTNLYGGTIDHFSFVISPKYAANGETEMWALYTRHGADKGTGEAIPNFILENAKQNGKKFESGSVLVVWSDKGKRWVTSPIPDEFKK